MTDSPKRISQILIIKNHLGTKPSLKILKNIIEANEFTIIEYNKYNNSEEVSTLIKQLHIEDRISSENSFLYINGKIKFIFLNSDLKESDKIIVLCHEIGHIFDIHISDSDYSYSSVEREDFANEFSHYLRHPSLLTKLISFFLRWKFACILALASLFLFASVFYINQDNSTTTPVFSPVESSGEYYVTSAGEKYHKSFCKHVKYKTNVSQIDIEDAISKGYNPCLDCIGE